MQSKYMGGIFLALAASIWGGMYVVSKYALDTIPPFTLLFVRYVLAFVLLAVICRIKHIPIIHGENRRILIQIGIIGYFLSIAAQFIGTKLTSAHMGAVITTLSPLFLSLFAVLLLKEKLTFKQAMASLLALVGVLIIMNPLQENWQQAGHLLGDMVLLLAALTWGYYSVLSRKASERFSPLQITTFAVLVAAVVDIPFVFMEIGQWDYHAVFSPYIVGSILYVAFIATALAFFWWNKGLALVTPHQAAPFFFFQPIVGTLLGWLLLQEQISAAFFGGGILIMIGVYISMQE